MSGFIQRFQGKLEFLCSASDLLRFNANLVAAVLAGYASGGHIKTGGCATLWTFVVDDLITDWFNRLGSEDSNPFQQGRNRLVFRGRLPVCKLWVS
jgi:hypothetical protein